MERHVFTTNDHINVCLKITYFIHTGTEEQSGLGFLQIIAKKLSQSELKSQYLNNFRMISHHEGTLLHQG